MPKPIPLTFETYDALTVEGDGCVTWLRPVNVHTGRFGERDLAALIGRVQTENLSLDRFIELLVSETKEAQSNKPGFDGYLIPWYTLSDRGTYFVPGAAKKTAKEQLGKAPHLYQHDTWEPIGKHAAAFEDDKGFRISVEVNESVPRGAETMSNLRFGTPLGLSVGFDPVADRSGTEADDKVLNRKTAPPYFKDVPINELRAITEFRWWESSTVTFAGIASAKPDVIHASAELLAALLTALKDGTATREQMATVEQIVAAHRASAAPGNPGTDELDARRRTADIAAVQARLAALTATHGAAA